MNYILEARDVCKNFGGIKAVHHVNMQVPEKAVFGIIGPNGAGKTTFFNLCSGKYRLSSGQIFFEDEEITNKPPEVIGRKGIVRTFQNIQLFKYLSVLENVKAGCHIHTQTGVFDAIIHTRKYREDEKYAEEQARRVLDEVGLSEYADMHAGNLAYGIQRKVEIARALAAEPKLLLLDEPAAGMNPAETWSLLEFIRKIREKGHTVIVIEHDMKFVMNLCDEILVLNFGEKICEGKPKEVQNNLLVQEAYFGKGIISETSEVK